MDYFRSAGEDVDLFRLCRHRLGCLPCRGWAKEVLICDHPRRLSHGGVSTPDETCQPVSKACQFPLATIEVGIGVDQTCHEGIGVEACCVEFRCHLRPG